MFELESRQKWKKTLTAFVFYGILLFKVIFFCVSTQQILGEIKCPFFSFCLLFSTIASGVLKPKKTPSDLSALIVLQRGFREIISTLRHKADVPVMTCQQKGVCFSFTSSLFLIPYQISFPHICHLHGCDACWWERRGRSSSCSTCTVKPPVSSAVTGHGSPAHRYCGSGHWAAHKD